MCEKLFFDENRTRPNQTTRDHHPYLAQIALVREQNLFVSSGQHGVCDRDLLFLVTHWLTEIISEIVFSDSLAHLLRDKLGTFSSTNSFSVHSYTYFLMAVHLVCHISSVIYVYVWVLFKVLWIPHVFIYYLVIYTYILLYNYILCILGQYNGSVKKVFAVPI